MFGRDFFLIQAFVLQASSLRRISFVGISISIFRLYYKNFSKIINGYIITVQRKAELLIIFPPLFNISCFAFAKPSGFIARTASSIMQVVKPSCKASLAV